MVAHYDQDIQDLSFMAYDQYMRFVKWTPELTREEEAELIERVERGKVERSHPCPDMRVLEDARQARDRLVEGFQPLVLHIARRVARRTTSLELLDLVQEGNIGLLQAIEDNDVRKGKPLRALAMRCINHALHYAIGHHDPQIRFGHRILESLRDVRKAEKYLHVTLEREPLDVEIAGEAGITEEKLHRLYGLVEQQKVKSLQSLLYEDESEDKYHFVSVFGSETSEEPSYREDLEPDLHQALETVLTWRQRDAVLLRYGFTEQAPEGCAFERVAQTFGITNASAQNRERLALQRLRKALDVEEVA